MGLTGGIGSGKSAVSARLAEHGAVIIDADALARDVVARGTAGLAAVVEAFGPGVLRPDGSLDREGLGRIVFADPAARRRLEGITHPLIREETARRFSSLPADAIVVHDIPLLVEAGMAGGYDVVVVVEAPRELRLQRLEARGLPRAQAEARMANQADDAARRAVADVVLDNSGTLADLHAQVDALWQDLVARRDAAIAAKQPAGGDE
ncbi:MAG: dephospho-CoA kinase [Frankia sp.]|nr:dephospho-CoA kinase [Frankia sp.]